MNAFITQLLVAQILPHSRYPTQFLSKFEKPERSHGSRHPSVDESSWQSLQRKSIWPVAELEVAKLMAWNPKNGGGWKMSFLWKIVFFLRGSMFIFWGVLKLMDMEFQWD